MTERREILLLCFVHKSHYFMDINARFVDFVDEQPFRGGKHIRAGFGKFIGAKGVQFGFYYIAVSGAF